MSEAHEEVPTTEIATEDDAVIVRRGHAATRLLPREAPPVPDNVVVQRSVLARRSSDKPQTSRQRKVAGDLPDWEPLPPGELVVHRTRGT